MKKQDFLSYILFSLAVISGFIPSAAQAQRVVYEENFGTPTATTLVQNYTGWQNQSVIYTGDGTCDIRSSSASNNYGMASGGGNVMINDTVKWFMVSGLNTAADTNLSLYCGLRKTNAENGSNLVVEVSADSLQWTRLHLSDTLPTGTGTSGWYRVRYPGIPSCANLHIRFSNLAHVDYRIDDLSLVVGEETVLETAAKPTLSPAGGTYYEPQTVNITTSTEGAVIYYTMDNSAPTDRANRYEGPLTINSNCTVKAVATKENMYDSEVATASYTILDTNSLVILPFDISDNSNSTHTDILQMRGFRGYHLGSSYSDGSVKFESSHAGEASLVAHLDSAPETLVFELKGKKGGSNPSAYEGVTFTVSHSADGQNWTPLASIFGDDISLDNFTRFSYTIPDHGARYIRWTLQASNKGNTQLNNIKITKHTDSGDSTAVADFNPETFGIYPNPTQTQFKIHLGRTEVQSMTLYNLLGQVVKTWEHPQESQKFTISDIPCGTYILKAITPYGTIQKKMVKY